jgi:glycosyltransferase involved in cell wall biosynthesis
MSKIKVLHILYEIMPSGAEMMLFSAYPYWEQECEMYILATGPTEGTYADILRKRGYQVDYLPIQKGCAPGGEKKVSKIRHIQEFRRYMKEHSFDAVHIHKESLSENYAAVCAKSGVKTIVRTVHNNFRFEGLLKIRKAHSRRTMQKKHGVIFVAISDGVASNEKNVFGITCNETIYNWCDDSKYAFICETDKQEAKKTANVSDKFTILTSATCNHVKNHELLLRAIGAMRHREKIHYYHVGYRKRETEQEMQLANELKVADCVEFAGFTDPQPYMKKTDVFVMPSLFEGLSIAALEAVFSGTHLLLADTPGLVEFRDKGFPEIDYFHLNQESPVGEQNVQTLARTLDELVERWEAGRLKNSSEQRTLAEGIYSANVGAAQYLKLYGKHVRS